MLIPNWRKVLVRATSVQLAVAGFVLSAVGMALLVIGQFQAGLGWALALQVAGIICMGLVPLARIIKQETLQ